MDEDRVLAAIAALTTTVGELSTTVGDLSTKVVALDVKVDRVQSDMTDFRVAVMDRFERVENRLNALTADVAVSMHASQNAIRLHRNRSDEAADLNGTVIKMQLQIQRL